MMKLGFCLSNYLVILIKYQLKVRRQRAAVIFWERERVFYLFIDYSFPSYSCFWQIWEFCHKWGCMYGPHTVSVVNGWWQAKQSLLFCADLDQHKPYCIVYQGLCGIRLRKKERNICIYSKVYTVFLKLKCLDAKSSESQQFPTKV